ncbi:hypothetical protein [Streptomyces sp. ICN988]|uniref:hypothetical protein n=1 Tax=Streptomyces sp. ICN988 TaxID=2983765 RepID=UPI00398D4511
MGNTYYASPVPGTPLRLRIDFTRTTSVHTAVASGVVIMIAYGWWAALLFLGVAAVGWSRVSLRDHVTAQVIAGTILGGTAAAVVFAGLR